MGVDSIFVFQSRFGIHFQDLWEKEPLPLSAAMWARLAEIGVRTTFIAVTFIATLVLEEVEEEINDLAEETGAAKYDYEQESIILKFYECVSHYHLASLMIKQINRCFSLVLLIITAIDFSASIFYFFQIYIALRRKRLEIDKSLISELQDLFVARDYNGEIIVEEVISSIIGFIHVFLRFGTILIFSHRGSTKVRLLNTLN